MSLSIRGNVFPSPASTPIMVVPAQHSSALGLPFMDIWIYSSYSRLRLIGIANQLRVPPSLQPRIIFALASDPTGVCVLVILHAESIIS